LSLSGSAQVFISPIAQDFERVGPTVAQRYVVM